MLSAPPRQSHISVCYTVERATSGRWIGRALGLDISVDAGNEEACRVLVVDAIDEAIRSGPTFLAHVVGVREYRDGYPIGG